MPLYLVLRMKHFVTELYGVFFITHCRLLFANERTKYNEDKEFIKSYSLGILYYYCGLQTVCAFGFLLFLSSS